MVDGGPTPLDTRRVPAVGDTLGRYTLLRRLAVGGMGEVFVAAKPGPVGFGPYVALKVLRDELACDPTFVDMLVDEANISMFLNHQNVVSVLDLGADDDAYYIAMEYVQGITLERLTESFAARAKHLAVPVALYIGVELCRALKYAHTRVNHQGEPLNIVHRDVTPANILLSSQGEVKLTDFGIARAKGRIHQTQAGVLKGKFGYMAPEMVRYEQIDARADLFCAGVCLYLMLAGKHPVAGAAIMEAIQNYEERRIPPPSTLNASVSPELDAIVMRCLEPKVENRWSSAAELGDVLRDALVKDPASRAAGNDYARLVAGQIHDVAPEAFDAPVSAEQTRHLLEKARADRARARGQSVVPAPLGQDRLPHLQARIPSARPGPAAGDPRTEEDLVAAPAMQSQDLIELPTATSLPAISPDMDFGKTPALIQDGETDEQLSLHNVRAARHSLDADLDTDEQNPGDTDDSLPMLGREYEGAVPSAPATVGTEASGVAFNDSTTDSSRLRAVMVEEPSLPEAGAGGYSIDPGEESQDRTVAQAYAYEEEVIDRPLEELPDEDGATVVGHGADDLVDPGPKAQPSFAEMVASPSRPVVSATVPMPARDLAHDDLDAPTIIPDTPGPEMFDTSEWAAAELPSDGNDATLLDGIDSADVAAALSAQARALAPGASTTENPVAPHVYAQANAGGLRDSVQAGRGSAIDPASTGPQPLRGPVRLEASVPPGAVGPGVTAQPPKPASWPPPVGVPPLGAAVPVPSLSPVPFSEVAVPVPVPVVPVSVPIAPVSSFNDGEVSVGASTGRWMAGQLDAGALAWDDDAAARRAVATRNQGAGPGAWAPELAPQSYPPAGVGSVPPQHLPFPPTMQPGLQATPSGLSSQKLMLLATVLLAMLLAGGGAYAWFYTHVFWPTLNLESEPAGALVLVDGVELTGTTPVTVRVQPQTKHTIEFRRPGYKSTTREITKAVSQLGNYKLRAVFTHLIRQVHLPAEGTVFVNGEAVATGRKVELANIPAQGSVTLRVEAKGYKPYEAVFADPAEIPNSLDIPLSKL